MSPNTPNRNYQAINALNSWILSITIIGSFLLPVSILAQSELQPIIWLRSTDNGILGHQIATKQAQTPPPTPHKITQNREKFIANYPVFQDSSEHLLKGLKGIANEYTGSLFVVLRNDSITPTLPLLWVGPTRIYRDSTLVREHSFDNIKIDSNSILVRVQYQGSPLMKNIRNFIQVDRNTKIAEVLFFDDYLNDKNSRVIESYLALKYSINISRNRDRSLRDYLTLTGEKVWQYQADKEYSKSILGLGRVDAFNFFQLNTFSSDARSIQFSVDDTLRLGDERNDSLADNSLVVIAEKKFSTLKSTCNTLVGERYWKLRFHNWTLGNPYLYLTLDANYQPHSQYYVLDGITQYLVNTIVKNGRSTIPIPVPHTMTNGIMYVVSTQTDSSCIPTLDYMVDTCGDSTGSLGSLHFGIQADLLPITVNVHSEQDGFEKEFIVNDPWFVITDIDGGTYRIKMVSRTQVLMDKLVTLDQCPSSVNDSNQSTSPKLLTDFEENQVFNSATSKFNGRSLDNGSSNVQLQRVSIFPNPSTSLSCWVNANLPGSTELEVDIFDAQGKRIASHLIDLKARTRLEIHFPQTGIYTVRCSNSEFSSSETVIIY